MEFFLFQTQKFSFATDPKRIQQIYGRDGEFSSFHNMIHLDLLMTFPHFASTKGEDQEKPKKAAYVLAIQDPSFPSREPSGISAQKILGIVSIPDEDIFPFSPYLKSFVQAKGLVGGFVYQENLWYTLDLERIIIESAKE